MRRPRVEYSAPLSRAQGSRPPARWLVAATVLATVGVGACGEGFQHSSRSQAPVPLSEAEATRLLTDLNVSTPGAHDVGPEMFRGDGRYYRRGLAMRTGVYTVSGNEVCVSLDGDTREPFCRYLFSVAGGYALSPSRNPKAKSEVTILSRK